MPEPASGETRYVATHAFTADAAGMDTVHAALDHAWRALDVALPTPPDALWRMLFTTAVGEIAANIITHAHGASGATATLRLELRPDRLIAIFTDQGAPYEERPRPASDDPGDADDLDDLDTFAEHGRGIPLARAALDTLTYTRTPAGENIWTLEKRFTG